MHQISKHILESNRWNKKVQYIKEILFTSSDKGEMNKTSLEMEEDDTVDDIILGLKSLGEIKVTIEKMTIPVDTDQSNKSQVEVETKFPRRLTFKQQFTLDNGYYTGCCTLPSGLMVFADNYDVKIIESNGSLQTSVKFKEKESAHDATVINENYVAISNPDSETIIIIDVDQSKAIKTLQIKSEICGITYSDGHIFFCVPEKGIMKVNIKNEKIDKVHDDQTVYYHSHIDTYNDRICYTSTSTRNDAITVLGPDYRVIFTFKNDNILFGPYGIAMDQHRNIFVCNFAISQLLLISRDGDKHEVLINRDDGIR